MRGLIYPSDFAFFIWSYQNIYYIKNQFTTDTPSPGYKKIATLI